MIALIKLYYFLLYGTTDLKKARQKYEIKPVRRLNRIDHKW
jgi:hypothetical protein